MFSLIDKIDKGLESKANCTVIEKAGKHLHGVISDSWVCISGGRLRGKLVFESEEKGRVEIDANDILDVIITKG